MSARLGFMLRIPNGDDLTSRYRDALELAVAADQLGLDSFWVTQHHFGSVDCPLSSPLVFLAAAAARTKNIRLGTTVITASLENPIRLAEDAATLDVLSGGRVELGLGTTTNPTERAAFSVSAEGQRELMHRIALEVREAFEGKPVNGLSNAILQPRTPALARRMWLATSTREHAIFAASQGFGLITNYRPLQLNDSNLGYIEAYCRACSAAGFTPRVGLSRGIFPAKDKASARRMLAPHAAWSVERGKTFGWLPATFSVDDYFAREDFYFGHPEEVIAELAKDPGLPYTTELLAGMLSARLTPSELIPVVELIATEVAPALGWKKQHACPQ